MALISDILREEVGVLVGGVQRARRGVMELVKMSATMDLEGRGFRWGVRVWRRGIID